MESKTMSSYFNYAWVELQDLPTYTFFASCFEKTLSFKVTWIERTKRRAISVVGSDGTVYLQNTVISLDEPLDFNMNAISDGYACSIMLQKDPDSPKEIDYYNWSKSMYLTVFRVTED